MKANELRIGNIIKNENDSITHIVELTDYDRVAMGENRVVSDLSNCEPVPLTEEWLLKFGFIFSHSRGFEEYYDKNDVGLTIIGSGTPDIKILYRSTQLKFIHQLQNIYFALTAEELTIK